MKKITFAILNEDRTLNHTGYTDEPAFIGMKASLGDRVLEIEDPAVYSAGDTIDASGAVVDKAAPPEVPTVQLTLSQQRAIAYPDQGVLADAIYWKENGNPEPYQAWLAACAAVKEALPKPE